MVTVLMRAAGRGTVVDPRLTTTDLAQETSRRAAQLARGVIRFRTRCFVGRRVRILGSRNLRLGRFSVIDDESVIDARGTRMLTIGQGSKLGRRGFITTTSKLSLVGVGIAIGDRTGVGDFFHIGCSGGVEIGDDVIVGPFFTVHSQEHVFDDPNVPIREQGTVEAPVTVGNNCWIGARVTLLAGTVLGDRTVVAAGSVVRGTHPGNEILAGVPARRLREI